MTTRTVTDHAGHATRINPVHVTHIICYTHRCPSDPAVPERMDVGLVTGAVLTFCYRTPADASRAARHLDASRTTQRRRLRRAPSAQPAQRRRGGAGVRRHLSRQDPASALECQPSALR
jgi:hypothetical protein